MAASQVQAFVNPEARRFWSIRLDFNNRRIVIYYGKLGKVGGRRIQPIHSREEARDYVERQVEQRVDRGYVQIA